MMSAGEGQLDAIERTIDLPSMVAYGGATWDWNRLHYDTAYTSERKLPAPVVDGQMFGALLAEHAMNAAGPRGFPSHMDFRYKAMVFAGETVRVDGRIIERDEKRLVVEQTISVGDRVAVTGTTTVTMNL